MRPAHRRLSSKVCVSSRWFQIPVGVILLLFSSFCLMASALMLFAPSEENPVFCALIGAVWVLGCLWVIEKCIRLIIGKTNRGGLMSPRSLRAVALLFLLIPFGGLFTGYFRTHTLAAIEQTAAYICIFFGLRRLAAQRESSDASPSIEWDDR